MTRTKTSTTTPKKKSTPQKFYIAGRDVIKDNTAPIVGGEFITEGGDWQGQTVEVKSEKHLEDDLGTGDPIVIRTFEFALNPVTFRQHEERFGHQPTMQEIFTEHKKGIIGMLWQDGLTPAQDIEPRLIFQKEGKSYFIMVGARPQVGQSVVETPQTLSQIANDPRNNTDKVHRKL